VLRLYKVLGFIYVLHLPEMCCICGVEYTKNYLLAHS
jgi:hypothetical protein